jgi:hypothetical protein
MKIRSVPLRVECEFCKERLSFIGGLGPEAKLCGEKLQAYKAALNSVNELNKKCGTCAGKGYFEKYVEWDKFIDAVKEGTA